MTAHLILCGRHSPDRGQASPQGATFTPLLVPLSHGTQQSDSPSETASEYSICWVNEFLVLTYLQLFSEAVNICCMNNN